MHFVPLVTTGQLPKRFGQHSRQLLGYAFLILSDKIPKIPDSLLRLEMQLQSEQLLALLVWDREKAKQWLVLLPKRVAQ